MACRDEGDYDSLATLNIYNINAIDPVIVTQQSQSQHQQVRSGKQRPVSAKTDSKTGRLLSGKISRPASAKRPTHNKLSVETGQLALSGISSCQPYYYDSSPAESFRQYRNSSSVTPAIPVTPVAPVIHVTPVTHMNCLQDDFHENRNDLYSHETVLRVPCSTPVLDESMPDVTQGKSTSVHQSNEFGGRLDQPNQLNLALPDVNDSADEGEDEIDTLRLLDDLNIDFSGGIATVSVTPQLRAKLASTKVQESSHGDSNISGPAVGNHPAVYNAELDALTGADVKLQMEKEIESMLSLHRSTNKAGGQSVHSSVRQSRDCWSNDLPRTEPITQGSAHEEVDDSSHSSITSNGSSADNWVDLDPQKRFTEEHSTALSSPKHTDCEEFVVESAEKIPPVGTASNSNCGGVNNLSSTEREKKEDTRDTGLDKLLYRWNIDVTKADQVPEMEVPLFNKRKNYDAIDDEIDRRVDEIERQLAEQIAESELAISKLEADVSNTKFMIPQFCEIDNQMEAKRTTSSANSQPASAGFSLQRADVNVLQQANKLGLKHRDVSRVFRVVTPRKKYVSSGEGKVNVSNVSSRINSGLRKKRNTSGKGEVKVKQADETKDQLCLAGNTRPVSETKIVNGDVQHGKQTIQKSVSFHHSLNADKPAEIKKAIKTLTFSDCGVVEEGIRTTQPIHPRSAPARYQVPAEVKSHMSKCIRKPPANPHSSNKKPEHQPISKKDRSSRQPRIRSAPSNRKLSRERSAERKLVNGFTNATTTEVMLNNESSLIDGPTASSAAATVEKPEQCKSERRQRQQQEVPTAMELIADDSGQSAFIEAFQSPDNSNDQQEGGLSGMSQPTRPFSAHPTTKKSAGPVKRAQSAPVKRRVVSHATPIDITTVHKHVERKDPEELQQISNVHDKVCMLGVEVDRSLLDRALFPPAEQSVSSCRQQMGRQLHTTGLLSSPDKWLKEEYRNLKKAKEEIQLYERGLKVKKKGRSKVEKV